MLLLLEELVEEEENNTVRQTDRHFSEAKPSDHFEEVPSSRQ